MTRTPNGVQEAADRLINAARTRRQCEPVRDTLGDDDVEAAYAVQRVITEDSVARGRTIVGHKIGLTSPAVQRQLDVDQPDSGVLFADMQIRARGTVPTGALLQPKVEAELAFILAEDLDGDLTDARIARAAGTARPQSTLSTPGSGTGRSASWTPSPTTVPRRCSSWVTFKSPSPNSTSRPAPCA
jgi:2-keto-4-pentenoate hydratase